MLNHNSPHSIRLFLQERNLAPRKHWGQNFLVNRGAREKIISALSLTQGLSVWEIGPGLGAMSTMLAAQNVLLTVFEIDPSYCAWLQETLAHAGVIIVRGNVLATWQQQHEKSSPDRITGNLPYNIAAQFIAKLVVNNSLAEENVFTVQKEIANRMTAAPGSKDYSSFSVLCQSMTRITHLGNLKPGSFYPVPRVSSSIISLTRDHRHGVAENPGLLQHLVRTLFSNRRKMLGSSIQHAPLPPGLGNTELITEAFQCSGMDLKRRPETLSPSEWITVSNMLSRLAHNHQQEQAAGTQ